MKIHPGFHLVVTDRPLLLYDLGEGEDKTVYDNAVHIAPWSTMLAIRPNSTHGQNMPKQPAQCVHNKASDISLEFSQSRPF